jgi:hypothetical protein
MARRRLPRPHYIINLLLSVVVLGLFSLTGIRVSNTTSAASSNPYGFADYCVLEDNVTAIYGWAADPDASALAQPAVRLEVAGANSTALTNRANYRDSTVLTWIDANRGADPKPGTYGFRISLPGLYKGGHYPLSGTILNEAAGSNTLLTINNSAGIGDGPNKSFFADNVIPDTCLADPGVTVALAPATALPIPALTNSDTTGSAVTTGTLAAEFRVPAQNTASVRIIYGKNPLKLDQSSSDVPTSGPETTIQVSGLEAATSYAYRVVRTDTKHKQTNSPLANFTTLGFVVATHFVDSRNSGIQGIQAHLNGQNKQKTSDESGNVQFINVPGGEQTVSYSYLHKIYTRSFTANPSTVPPAEATAPHVVTLDFSIDLQSLPAASMVTVQKSGSAMSAIIIGAVILAFMAIITFLFIQSLRRKRDYEIMLGTPAPPLPEYRPLSPQMPPVVPGQPGADHMGESLKKLVLRTMREEAARAHEKPSHR